MKKFLLLICLMTFAITLMSQSVKFEKIDLRVKNQKLYPSTDTITSYKSNGSFLHIYGVQAQQESPDLNMTINQLPFVKYNIWQGSTRKGRPLDIGVQGVHVSEPSVFSIMDKNGDLLYHRVYNYFDIKPVTETSKVLQPAISLQYLLSEQASFFFSQNYVSQLKFRMHYVNKSLIHTDVNSGYDLALRAVGLYNSEKFEEANALLDEAIVIWNQALTERNIKDRKSRINRGVTEALYRNIIQSLFILERFDEADELINTSSQELGGLFPSSLRRYIYPRQRLELNYRIKKSEGKLSHYDLELPKDLKPIIATDYVNVPNDPSDIRNLLLGSWRIFSISANHLPKTTDGFDIANREQNLMKILDDGLLHLNPDGTKIQQDGAFERIGKGEIDFWNVSKGPNGEYFLFFSYDKESLNNINKNFNNLEYSIIHHISTDKLILKRANYDPDSDNSGYFIQLYRVGKIFEEE